jgi:hypothetical protein
MKLCDYGCGQEAKFPFKNGKWCCSTHFSKCPKQRKGNSLRIKEIWDEPNSVYDSILRKENLSNSIKKIHKDPNSKYNSIEYRKQRSNNMKKLHKDPNSNYHSISYKNKQKLNIEYINKKYPFFSKIEEMRYNLEKPNEKEIQVHCKNHECKNSKEKDGWFSPTYNQLSGRINALEKDDGNGGHYFYCSQHCKDTCILYGLYNDPYEIKNTTKPYTPAEQGLFNQHILKRDVEICYYCGEHATIVHHLRPQKLEPFFALDPDYAVSCCEKCHYKHGHPTGSDHSTGNLAKIVCSVESQKFLNQIN